MSVGELYVWPDCYIIECDTGRITSTLMIFCYLADGSLYPNPVLGVNVTRMPEGEGTTMKEVHRRFAIAKRN